MSATLEVDHLTVELATRAGALRPVRDVSFSLGTGETLGLVGESGCGKSLTALAIMRLLPSPPASLAGGEVRLGGRDLATLEDRQLRHVRGSEMSMVFQEPMTSLDPVFSVGRQMTEMLHAHMKMTKAAAKSEAVEMLRRVRVTRPEHRLGQYPHELSGGMRQRVMIAIALSLGPKVLIADEPTTALDVTVQAEILRLMKTLQAEMGMALLLISHNLGVVSAVADRVAVMYAGEIVEEGDVVEIFRSPAHPYTRALLEAIPLPEKKHAPLATIPGRVPAPSVRSVGCSFRERCPLAKERCGVEHPPLEATSSEKHLVRCWRWRDVSG